MSYFTIRNDGYFEFEEKKSKFIGRARRVYTEVEAKAFIEEVNMLNKDARHNVYAYVIGEKLNIERYNDDGEPQGTAGIPMLQTIKKINVTDVVVVVTRYFGGILLGTGGLARAYSKAASMALKEGDIVEKVLGVRVDIKVSYELLGKLQYAFEQKNWHIENIEYTDKVNAIVFCEITELDKIKNTVVQVSSGSCFFKIEQEKYYFKNENRLFL
jgi:uncharacterized YigZ family protein